MCRISCHWRLQSTSHWEGILRVMESGHLVTHTMSYPSQYLSSVIFRSVNTGTLYTRHLNEKSKKGMNEDRFAYISNIFYLMSIGSIFRYRDKWFRLSSRFGLSKYVGSIGQYWGDIIVFGFNENKAWWFQWRIKTQTNWTLNLKWKLTKIMSVY